MTIDDVRVEDDASPLVEVGEQHRSTGRTKNLESSRCATLI